MSDSTPTNPVTPFRKARRRAYQALDEENLTSEISETTTPNPVLVPQDNAQRQAKAQAIVNRAMWLARGVGIVPIPWLDFVALSAIQMTMLTQLSYLYGVNFSKYRAKKILFSLSSSANAALSGSFIMHSVGRLAPGFSTVSSLLTMPLLGGALTYAVGKTFIKHYELGGTLLDFDPQTTRDYFQTQLQRNKPNPNPPS